MRKSWSIASEGAVGRRYPVRALGSLASLVLLVLAVSGCSPVVRDRTLPPSIGSVYVPMITNRTSETGLEERLTVAIQEEILADGRLDVVPRRDADATVEITLNSFNERSGTLDDEGFAAIKFMDIAGTMDIRENIPGRPLVGERRDLELSYLYNDDPRTTTYNPEPAEIRQMARFFAREVLLELMTGELEDDAVVILGAPAGSENRAPDANQRVRLPERDEP